MERLFDLSTHTVHLNPCCIPLCIVIVMILESFTAHNLSHTETRRQLKIDRESWLADHETEAICIRFDPTHRKSLICIGIMSDLQRYPSRKQRSLPEL
jgi:hypothetical protein